MLSSNARKTNCGRTASSHLRGFTLLEVLVALVIVGTALGASLRAVGSLSQNSAGLRASMMATWSAENRLTQIRLEKGIFPALGKSNQECPQGELHLICEQEVLPTPNVNFRRVEVSVYDAQNPDRRLIKLNQVVSN
jgi:general secretion pathway protein I